MTLEHVDVPGSMGLICEKCTLVRVSYCMNLLDEDFVGISDMIHLLPHQYRLVLFGLACRGISACGPDVVKECSEVCIPPLGALSLSSILF